MNAPRPQPAPTVTEEALDGNPLTRGLERPFDGNSYRLDEQMDAFDGLAQTNPYTDEFGNGQASVQQTIDAFDGNAVTNSEFLHFRTGMSFDMNRVADAFDGQAHTNRESERYRDGRVDVEGSDLALNGTVEATRPEDSVNVHLKQEMRVESDLEARDRRLEEDLQLEQERLDREKDLEAELKRRNAPSPFDPPSPFNR